MSTPTPPAAQDQPAEQPEQSGRTVLIPVRRVVSFSAFIFTGAVLGFIAGAILDLVGPDDPRVTGISSFAFFGALGALGGALVAAIIAVVIDARS